MYYNFVVNLSFTVCNVKPYGGFQHLWSHCFDVFSAHNLAVLVQLITLLSIVFIVAGSCFQQKPLFVSLATKA